MFSVFAWQFVKVDFQPANIQWGSAWSGHNYTQRSPLKKYHKPLPPSWPIGTLNRAIKISYLPVLALGRYSQSLVSCPRYYSSLWSSSEDENSREDTVGAKSHDSSSNSGKTNSIFGEKSRAVIVHRELNWHRRSSSWHHQMSRDSTAWRRSVRISIGPWDYERRTFAAFGKNRYFHLHQLWRATYGRVAGHRIWRMRIGCSIDVYHFSRLAILVVLIAERDLTP